VSSVCPKMPRSEGCTPRKARSCAVTQSFRDLSRSSGRTGLTGRCQTCPCVCPGMSFLTWQPGRVFFPL
jgi:hypothetical protein